MYFLITLSELPEVCKNPSLLETIKYLFYIIKIITILTPIILIVALMIRLVKAFLKDDEVFLSLIETYYLYNYYYYYLKIISHLNMNLFFSFFKI